MSIQVNSIFPSSSQSAAYNSSSLLEAEDFDLGHTPTVDSITVTDNEALVRFDRLSSQAYISGHVNEVLKLMSY